MPRIRIIYEGTLSTKFDKAIKKIAEKFGYEFIGSSYDFILNERDIDLKK